MKGTGAVESSHDDYLKPQQNQEGAREIFNLNE
jgi:hypothetical protein